MRLIDADELLKYMETAEIRQSIDEINKGNDNYSSTDLYVYIKEMPTAYDVDKVVERLDKERSRMYYEDGSLMLSRTNVSIDKAVEIVRSGGIE